MSKHQQCISCASKDLNPVPGYYERHGLVRCKSCSMIFIEQVPTAATLEAHYRNYVYNEEQFVSELTLHSFNTLLDQFEFYRSTNKILDVGCGSGHFLIEAKKRGWEVYGTEYSAKAVDVCENSGIRMKKGELNANNYDSTSFDVVTSFEVIEHINNPNSDLSQIYSLLRSGGLFYCTTPNFNSIIRYYLKADYNIIEYPEHLAYYTKKTLNRTICRHGFKPIKFLSTGISITRIKTSKNRDSEVLISESSSDEKLRQKISKNWYLGVLKRFINHVLTLTNFGMTLKGYYLKP